ncbi:IS3 family transposase [Bifidobacterium callitrichos]|uniref:Transposase domain protein n=1 Tax=Bifidobacterium callitrichos DSM 23973 TaxID=1437609 RepID=A0A087AD62_9BIFI|nr:IS3 family transposase [Bifidobacterium callitrichos]KFI56712.1 transposase domain protein [Bifidobacterium callitrichos DSM 23973]
MRKSAELVGKKPGADPDNLTNREKATLIRAVSEEHGVRAEDLLGRVGIARSTYYYQLKPMNRPDRDRDLLALVREAFENSRRRYGYKRIHQELRSAGVIASAKRIMRLMTMHGLVARVQKRETQQLVQGRDRPGARHPLGPGLSRARRLKHM